MEAPVRLIRSGALRPAMNLALDEALLRSGVETVRLYAWDPPGFSLGYFQEVATFDVPTGYELVRRPTGGGAIAHTGELTIAWIGRKRRVDDAYGVMNGIVQSALEALGLEIGRGKGQPEAAPPGLCFDHHTCYDLMVGDRKVFGSAQRRGGDRFLLHGSLVVSRNPESTGAISLEEALGRAVSHGEAEQAVIRAVDAALGSLRAAQPTAEEWQRANRLVADRYGAEAWTARR